MVNIEKAFVTENRSVFDFFQQPGMGFYIPLYQREYSWDSDNIDQLLEDISRGIERLSEDAEDEIRFLGTIITVAENNKNNIQPQDTQALPARIEKLIDGQQRLSTIAIFATLLYNHIAQLEEKSKKLDKYSEELSEMCQQWKDKLLVIFSLDLGRGNPRRKPKLIRGQKDKWVREGEIDTSYTSPIANYLASFLDFIYNEKPIKPIKKEISGQNFTQNIKTIDSWIKKSVMSAHLNKADDFLSSRVIINKIDEDLIWVYKRPHLVELVNNFDLEIHNSKTINYILCGLTQLFAVCHYLLERCCFTIIQPSNDDWAFDMFQSLNATGTPLTAIETFKPLVVNTTEKELTSFKGSNNEKSFNKIEDLFKKVSNANQKSKLTNDFLTSFSMAYDGYKLSSHFSYQRKRLEKYFNDSNEFTEKSIFIKFFGDYAEFYRVCWADINLLDNRFINLITHDSESELAAVLISLLKESNHKMALTVLGHFYIDVINGKENSVKIFIQVLKCITAFYTLWRSSSSNAGLDSIYRDFFKGENKEKISLDRVKDHFKSALVEKGILKKEDWIQNAKSSLNYLDAKTLCKFALFIASNDTIPDDANPGLMKKGVNNCSPYLSVDKWNSKDLSSIEHVAPQTNDIENDWDPSLYIPPAKTIHSIGNLTLLPLEINISASNRNWKTKHLYYRHLSEKDPSKIRELANLARSNDISLSEETIKLLQDSNFNDHMNSITFRSPELDWNQDFIVARTNRILNILWEEVYPWILR